MTVESGVDFTYHNGEEANHYAILESLGGGVGLFDYDGDGLLDLFVTGGGYFDGPERKQIKGHPNRLYRNLGNWKFRDVTTEVGLDQPVFYSHGCAVADYDNDGWPDLLVTGYGRLALFRNVSAGNQGRRFVEVTKEAGLLRDHFWSTSAAWGDLDGDGHSDLYVCQYVNWSFANNPACTGYTSNVEQDVCPPRQFESRPHALYRNNGNGAFSDITREAGLRVEREDKDYGKGLGVLIVDLNDDRRPDIYVANDTTDNFLYLNRSRPGQFWFDDRGVEMGVARDDRGVANGSMGVDAADYDGSGRPSLWVTNYENELHALYRNVLDEGRHYFNPSTQVSGIAAIGQLHVGFGTGFLDVDNDSWEDIFITNGHVIRHPTPARLRQKPVLLRHQGNSRFAAITPQGGPYFRSDHLGRGVAIGDINNDGRPDLVVSHLNEPVVMLRNEADSGQHWLGIELVGKPNRNAVGAKLTLEVEGRRLTRFVKGGGSYLSANDPRRLFGLGPATKVGRLTVDWPSGEPRKQHWDGLAVDRYWRLVQGEREASAPSSGKRAAARNAIPGRVLRPNSSAGANTLR